MWLYAPLNAAIEKDQREEVVAENEGGGGGSISQLGFNSLKHNWCQVKLKVIESLFKSVSICF